MSHDQWPITPCLICNVIQLCWRDTKAAANSFSMQICRSQWLCRKRCILSVRGVQAYGNASRDRNEHCACRQLGGTGSYSCRLLPLHRKLTDKVAAALGSCSADLMSSETDVAVCTGGGGDPPMQTISRCGQMPAALNHKQHRQLMVIMTNWKFQLAGWQVQGKRQPAANAAGSMKPRFVPGSAPHQLALQAAWQGLLSGQAWRQGQLKVPAWVLQLASQSGRQLASRQIEQAERLCVAVAE